MWIKDQAINSTTPYLRVYKKSDEMDCGKYYVSITLIYKYTDIRYGRTEGSQKPKMLIE